MSKNYISQIKVKALLMLIRAGNICLDDIKDEDYRKAVENAMKD